MCRRFAAGPLLLCILLLLAAPPAKGGTSTKAAVGVDNDLLLKAENSQIAIFFDDFEAGEGDWFADGGVWQVGTPTVGPSSCFSGDNCAGTVLDGNYPPNASTRLISPYISLPELLPGERLKLTFRHWYSFSFGDRGLMQISVDDGAWETISSPAFDDASPAWTQYFADVSVYEGSVLRVAFLFTSDSNPNTVSSGWYVDDVKIEAAPVTLRNPEDFEFGEGDWYADNGQWQVGTPTAGPTSCFSGENCAGTVLNGNYPTNANSRLISPEFTFDENIGETPRVRIRHWFSFSTGDQGVIQISVDGEEWQNISGSFTANSGGWTQFLTSNLSVYAGSVLRVAFLFTSDSNPNTVSSGWYIDDVSFEGTVLPVDLASFDAFAAGTNIHLHWTTASEKNNAGFEIQQKIVGEFESVAYVHGTGNTSDETSYSYVLSDAAPGKHVFRLKQIDYDGTYSFSPEVEVHVDVPGAYHLTAPYPNPFNPEAAFTLAVDRAQDVVIEVYNVLGQAVQTIHRGELEADTAHRFTIDAGAMPSGVYLLRATGDTFMTMRTITVLK